MSVEAATLRTATVALTFTIDVITAYRKHEFLHCFFTVWFKHKNLGAFVIVPARNMRKVDCCDSLFSRRS